jgi:hypothetical protein
MINLLKRIGGALKDAVVPTKNPVIIQKIALADSG